jgi:mannose-6-phosphate isomerase-like protein (cupin superfamily)
LLLVVEAGTLSARIDGSARYARAGEEEMAASGDVTLGAGDALVVPAGVATAFRNEGPTTAVALAALVAPARRVAWNRTPALAEAVSKADHWPVTGAAGVAAQPLAGGRVADTPDGPATIEVGQVTLRSGASRPLATAGPVALAVTAGVLTVVAGQSQIWVEHTSGEDEWIAPGEEVVLLPGDGVLFQAGIVGSIRNDGSGLLLIDLLMLTPADQVTGSVASLATAIRVPALCVAPTCEVS